MTVSEAAIISRPRINASAEPIDSCVTAPRLWDRGRSASLLQTASVLFAADWRRERGSFGRLWPSPAGVNNIRWTMTPCSLWNCGNRCVFMNSCVCVCPVSIPAHVEWRAAFRVTAATSGWPLYLLLLPLWSFDFARGEFYKLHSHLTCTRNGKASITSGPTSRESSRVPLKLAASVPSTHSGAVNYRPRAARRSAIMEKVVI